jgi:hypothetical protein
MANIFASDFSAANTVGNFDSNVSHALVTCTREVGNGPAGNDTLRFVLAQTGVNSQPSWGLRKAVTDTVVQGDTRYYRLRLRYNGSTNFGGNNGPWYTKSVIWGNDNTGNGGRVIVWTGVGSIDNTTPTYWVSKNVGTKAASNLSITNAWNNIQVRIRSSSAAGVADGRVDLYIGADNTSESTPTSSVTGLDIDLTGTNGWTDETIGFGGEVDQTTLATGVGHVDMNVTDIVYATTFDTSWNSPAGGGGGTAIAFGMGLGEF